MSIKNLYSDDQYWESFKKGDDNSFEHIFKKHYHSLLSYGLGLKQDEEEIKECIQILFSTLWERREFLGNIKSIKNYLIASLRRLIIKRGKKFSLPNEPIEDNLHYHVEMSVEERFIKNQSLQIQVNSIQEAIKSLPDRQKEALYLKFYENQSFKDIGNILGISTRAVYKLIYKALDNLHVQLSARKKDVKRLLSVFF